MKKFLVCLMCCFGIFTLCSATSTVGDVYLNNFDILVNGENYSPTLPVLNYQGRTYLPLNEFGSMTGNDISFANNTISVNSNYTDYFYIYSKADKLKDYLNQLRNSFRDNYSYYNFSYYDRNYYTLLRDNLSLVETDALLVNSLLKDEELFVELCVKHNIATEQEVREIFNNVDNYAFSLKLIAGNMEFNAAKLDYSFDFTNGVNLSRDGLYEILTPLGKIEQKAFSKFYE